MHFSPCPQTAVGLRSFLAQPASSVVTRYLKSLSEMWLHIESLGQRVKCNYSSKTFPNDLLFCDEADLTWTSCFNEVDVKHLDRKICKSACSTRFLYATRSSHLFLHLCCWTIQRWIQSAVYSVYNIILYFHDNNPSCQFWYHYSSRLSYHTNAHALEIVWLNTNRSTQYRWPQIEVIIWGKYAMIKMLKVDKKLLLGRFSDAS